MAEKSKKAVEKRGTGVGGRQEFVLPARWESEVREFPSKQAMVYVSPGKSRYNHQKASKALRERGMDLCFEDPQCGTSTEESTEDECLTAEDDISTCEVAVPHRFLVCESTQITKMVDDINKTSKCATPGCNGK